MNFNFISLFVPVGFLRNHLGFFFLSLTRTFSVYSISGYKVFQFILLARDLCAMLRLGSVFVAITQSSSSCTAIIERVTLILFYCIHEKFLPIMIPRVMTAVKIANFEDIIILSDFLADFPFILGLDFCNFCPLCQWVHF